MGGNQLIFHLWVSSTSIYCPLYFIVLIFSTFFVDRTQLKIQSYLDSLLSLAHLSGLRDILIWGNFQFTTLKYRGFQIFIHVCIMPSVNWASNKSTNGIMKVSLNPHFSMVNWELPFNLFLEDLIGDVLFHVLRWISDKVHTTLF